MLQYLYGVGDMRSLLESGAPGSDEAFQARSVDGMGEMDVS